jgi:hypothetical protein
MIDRREIVRTFTDFDAEVMTLREAARRLAFDDLWQSEQVGFDRGVFRHVASGLTFMADHADRTATHYRILRVHQLATPATTVDAGHALLIGVAAFHLSAFTTMFRQPVRPRRNSDHSYVEYSA